MIARPRNRHHPRRIPALNRALFSRMSLLHYFFLADMVITYL